MSKWYLFGIAIVSALLAGGLADAGLENSSIACGTIAFFSGWACIMTAVYDSF